MISDQTNNIKLSILIPSITERIGMLGNLVFKLNNQIGERTDVEIISLIDNKQITIGEKRNAIKRHINGKYFCMIDDDDAIAETFIDDILNAIEQNDGVDVITYNSDVYIDKVHGVVHMSLSNENEQWTPGEITRRKPFQMCTWLTDKFAKVQFPKSMYGEDAVWSELACTIAQTEFHIDKPLHIYRFDKNITQAFQR